MVAMLRPRQAALAREEAGSAGMLGKLGREEVASPDIISKFSRVAARTAAIEDNRCDNLASKLCDRLTPFLQDEGECSGEYQEEAGHGGRQGEAG